MSIERGRMMRIVMVGLALVFSPMASLALGETRYDDHRLVRTFPTTPAEVTALESLGGIRLGVDHANHAADYVLPPSAMTDLAQLGVSYEVGSTNVQQQIDAERTRLAGQIVSPYADNWYDDYKTVDQINARLFALEEQYSGMCTVVDIGDSVEGRDIYALRIADVGIERPAVLFNGTQHAREWISPMVNMYIAEQLLTGLDKGNATVQQYLGEVEVIVAPMINPDGYAYSWTNDRMWRKNRRNNGGGSYGVDLNRNWDADWGGSGSSGNPNSETYRGTAPFSEPEAQALADFMADNQQITAHIDFHSYSQLILAPWGYTSAYPPDWDLLHGIGGEMQSAISGTHGEYYANQRAWDLYKVSGSAVDWAYDDQGILSYTIELRPDSYWPGFQLPADEILPTSEENYAAALALIARAAEQPWGTLHIAVPEPGTLMLLAIALVALAGCRWRGPSG